MLIGLTGLYCSGKNYIASLLEQRGFLVLDLDKLGYIAIENKKADICAQYGEDIKNPDGSINRRLLGDKVFGNKAQLAAMEAIVHPEVNRLSEEWIKTHNNQQCVINAALLHKSVFFNQLDCIILVSAPLLHRLIRAKKRDKLSWAAVVKRFASQKQFTAQYSAGNADIYKVENPGTEKPESPPNSDPIRIKLELQIDAIVGKLGRE